MHFKNCAAILLACYPIFLAAKDVTPIDVSLTPQDQAMIDWVDQRSDDILAELKTHVDINTGTENITGIDRYRALLKADLEQLGFVTQTHSSAPIPVLTCKGGEMVFADHLVGELRSNSEAKTPRLFLNGHMDTVFPAGDEFQTLQISEDGHLAGPGVADMKGGIVIMMNALRALHAQGLLEDVHITVLFNSDEEVGSIGSRPLIEELARQHDIGLIFEGSYENSLTRARKGLGQARLKVTGREAHAGGAHQDGVSANLELAHKIVAIEQLTDYHKKTTVNVGVMSGGEKRNTVPGCADAYIDLRFPNGELGEELKSGIKKIAERRHVRYDNYLELPKTESWAILHRPVKQVNARVDKLIGQAMGYSTLIGEPIVGTRYSGGGTDGSIAQAVGLPTIDSLGIDGAGAHSSRETASVQSLIARTKLAAVMIARQLAGEEGADTAGK